MQEGEEYEDEKQVKKEMALLLATAISLGGFGGFLGSDMLVAKAGEREMEFL